MSDAEFQIIVSELEHDNTLKEKVRAKLTRHSSRKNVADVEKIKHDIRSEVEAEFRKKSAVSPPLRINNWKQMMVFTYYKIMIASFHMLMCLVDDYFKPEWQRNVRDITREIVECLLEEHGTAV